MEEKKPAEGHELIGRVIRTIEERGLAGPESPVLLMVSGGSDSTALAYLATELSASGIIGPLGMLHVNHQLRDEDSDRDQAFVQNLAEALDIPLFICAIDVEAEVRRTGDNVEAVARRERYLAANEALESLCRHTASPLADGRIFTAHTQDDRVESFYMRSIVGTGPGGFRSMRYTNGPVVRPLLDVCRKDLRAYIGEREHAGKAVVCDPKGELWCEDATNSHTDRFRAFVRHEIVPRAQERNPQLLETLCRVMNLIADEDDMLDRQADQMEATKVDWLAKEGPAGIAYEAGCVLLPGFAQLPLPMQRRVCTGVLQKMLGPDARIETSSVTEVLSGFKEGRPLGGYSGNIQGNLAISANKQGLRIEPMEAYRARRKKSAVSPGPAKTDGPAGRAGSGDSLDPAIAAEPAYPSDPADPAIAAEAAGRAGSGDPAESLIVDPPTASVQASKD
ncbi:MAG: tRNA lysidine(34) synthetase TilS [Coriobacteriaceae bacterium]|nr:tRNA lysidine(34) synthetase TilS [Coriobacteriaceae bacterium]